MSQKVLFFLIFSWLPFTLILAQNQGPPASVDELEEAYQKRIQKEELYGVYIPADLGDAFVQLRKKADESGLQKFASLTEREAVTIPFFSLGRWISHNWGFYGGSRFTAYLNQVKLFHPDDMTRFVLVMFHRHLNEKPLNPQPVVEGLLAAREAKEQESKLRGELLHEETKQLERPADDGGGK